MPHIVRRLLLIATITFFAGVAAATAQTPYDNEEATLSGHVSLLDMGLSLRRDPQMPPENFILSIAPLNRSLSGCPPYKDISFETAHSGSYLDITLLSVIVDNSKYPYYDCNGKSHNPAANIVLNKNDLMDNGTRQIRLKYETLMMLYDMRVTDEMVSLERNCEEAKCINAGKQQSVPGLKDSMRLWFYPEGTLMLYTPTDGTEDKAQIAEKIHALAVAKGMEPLEDVYPDFTPPLIRDDFHYYVDSAGRSNEGILGSIYIDKMAYGLNGDEPVREKVDVYAKRPGAYE